MAITTELADTLHAIVDALPWREESDRDHHHEVIAFSTEAPPESTEPEPTDD